HLCVGLLVLALKAVAATTVTGVVALWRHPLQPTGAGPSLAGSRIPRPLPVKRRRLAIGLAMPHGRASACANVPRHVPGCALLGRFADDALPAQAGNLR